MLPVDASKKVVTSFKKKTSEINQIPGTRVSYHNAQLLTSTGVPSLDYYLGGGLPVGTVILIEEDTYNSYSSILLKYFISEGVTNNHSIFLASGDIAPEKLLSELPAVAEIQPKIKLPDDDELKIAWRYRGQKSSTETFASFGHQFDLSKIIPSEELEKNNIYKWNILNQSKPELNHHFVPEPYYSLLSEVKSVICKERFKTTDKGRNSLLRIAIGSLGSPLWNRLQQSIESHTDILRFLYVLRSLLRTSYSVAIITIKSTFLRNEKFINKIYEMCDFSIKLESFVGTEKSNNIMYKDFDGLLQIKKLPCLNTHSYQVPTSDLAFKLKRKQFLVERLHLPPDIQDSSENTLACGNQSKLLDF